MSAPLREAAPAAASWPPAPGAQRPPSRPPAAASPPPADEQAAPPATQTEDALPPLPRSGSAEGNTTDGTAIATNIRSPLRDSRAPTPAPVKAADAEVAAVLAGGAGSAGAGAGSALGGGALPTPAGFRAPGSGFRAPLSPAGGLAGPDATSQDEDTETEAVFRRARDAMVLSARAQLAADARLRGASTAAASSAAPTPLPGGALEASEWSTDDGGVTWVKAAASQRRLAAAAVRRAPRTARRSLDDTTDASDMPPPPQAALPPRPRTAPSSAWREALRVALLPLAVYLVLVGLWHHVALLLPDVAARAQ